jgi:tetratricopeptide (TPR) repeat protein
LQGRRLTAQDFMARAAALRAEQRMIEADVAISAARERAPDDPLIAFLHAQSRYELGYPAAPLFAQAARLWPDNPDVIRNHALALASEGQRDAADTLLAATLRAQPGWLDGHRVLASLRWTSGQSHGFDASFADAIAAEPANAGLWLGWFSAVAQVRDWPRADTILTRAEAALGKTKSLRIARIFVACETQDDTAARSLLDAAQDLDDPMLSLCRIRFALRQGDAKAAEAVARPMLATPATAQVWPYLSTCWRLLGDARAVWLDGDPAFVTTTDVGLTAAELDDLTACLRGLHGATRPYAEQSVRGGTQTDRSVLLRHEPILQRTRAALMDAVADYVAALPPLDPRHPLLSRPRKPLLISGSWSVRLRSGGHNVTHTHPMGWISSAFYVALPDEDDMGAPPAGWLTLGAPPPELQTGLAPYRRIQPKRGQLVLFPSTMWHATMPFDAGERLNLAFDVVPAA